MSVLKRFRGWIGSKVDMMENGLFLGHKEKGNRIWGWSNGPSN